MTDPTPAQNAATLQLLIQLIGAGFGTTLLALIGKGVSAWWRSRREERARAEQAAFDRESQDGDTTRRLYERLVSLTAELAKTNLTLGTATEENRRLNEENGWLRAEISRLIADRPAEMMSNEPSRPRSNEKTPQCTDESDSLQLPPPPRVPRFRRG